MPRLRIRSAQVAMRGWANTPPCAGEKNSPTACPNWYSAWLVRLKSVSMTAGNQSIKTRRQSSPVSALGMGGCFAKADCSASPDSPAIFCGSASTNRHSAGKSIRETSVPSRFDSGRPPSTRNPPCTNPCSPTAERKPRPTRLASTSGVGGGSLERTERALATARPNCVPEPNPQCAGMERDTVISNRDSICCESVRS